MRYQVLQAVCQRVVSCKYHVFREGAPFHGGNTGSNPVGDAKISITSAFSQHGPGTQWGHKLLKSIAHPLP
jgi:hypothetical protein